MKTFASTLATAIMALLFGFLGAAIWSYAGLADDRTRNYLLSNPDLLPQMAEAYQEQEASERLTEVRDEVMTVFPGAVLGNPNGTKTLVEFTDYNCPYCEASLADIERLISEDPQLKVVIREFPIFEGSEIASRMALAAAMQGKYDAFHRAMFERGPSTPESVTAAAQAAGLDMTRAEADAASDMVSVELARNMSVAQRLGFNGTPAWIVGDRAISGAISSRPGRPPLRALPSRLHTRWR
ncbi:MAG: DsbA family protein, partial [Pseudomonadota bacterium]